MIDPSLILPIEILVIVAMMFQLIQGLTFHAYFSWVYAAVGFFCLAVWFLCFTSGTYQAAATLLLSLNGIALGLWSAGFSTFERQKARRQPGVILVKEGKFFFFAGLTGVIVSLLIGWWFCGFGPEPWNEAKRFFWPMDVFGGFYFLSVFYGLIKASKNTPGKTR